MQRNKVLQEISNQQKLGQNILDAILIQELWSGYGGLYRIRTESIQYIIKLIEFPKKNAHPKGWDNDFAHKRKVNSYEVEMEFYANYNQHRDFAYSPKYLAHGKHENVQYLILEDLSLLGYKPKKVISSKEIENCIHWLAHFHMTYLEHPAKALWKTGTYWHLETRPKEYSVIQNTDLKTQAYHVDKVLNECPYQSLVHGDAKLANFLFSDKRVSAVDFQYCGGGIGVKDLAYFLSSIYDEDELFKNEDKVLDLYFLKLEKLGASSELIQAWRDLYPYAWFDFYRFLAGWSPEHYKINQYIKAQMTKVMDAIR